jgi:excinuclease UvrABC nuclease subunit
VHEPGKYLDSIAKSEAEIEYIGKQKTIRKRINKWLASQDQKKKIKGIVKELEK